MDEVISLIIGVATLVLIVGLYFLPTINASNRSHKDINPIFLLNLFLGWTLFGWVIALVWSAIDRTNSAETEGMEMVQGAVKKCHACAESIRAEAKICRYCGTEQADSAVTIAAN